MELRFRTRRLVAVARNAEWAWPPPGHLSSGAGRDLSERVTFSAAAAPRGVRRSDEKLAGRGRVGVGEPSCPRSTFSLHFEESPRIETLCRAALESGFAFFIYFYLFLEISFGYKGEKKNQQHWRCSQISVCRGRVCNHICPFSSAWRRSTEITAQKTASSRLCTRMKRSALIGFSSI